MFLVNCSDLWSVFWIDRLVPGVKSYIDKEKRKVRCSVNFNGLKLNWTLVFVLHVVLAVSLIELWFCSLWLEWQWVENFDNIVGLKLNWIELWFLSCKWSRLHMVFVSFDNWAVVFLFVVWLEWKWVEFVY